MTNSVLILLICILDVSTSQSHDNHDIQIGPHMLHLGNPTTLNITGGRGWTLGILDGATETSKVSTKTYTDEHSQTVTETEIHEPGVATRLLKSYRYGETDCLDVSTRAQSCVSQIITDCFYMNDTHWYGGAEMHQQLWPLEKLSMYFEPYVGQDNSRYPYGAVLERYFYNSFGIAYWVEEDIPLYVSINYGGDQKLCFRAEFDNVVYRNIFFQLPILNYTVCTGDGVMDIHRFMSDRYIGKPTGIPNEDVLRRPIWSTWAQYKKNINQTLVLEFADNILKNNFSISQLEIDEKWMPDFGDLVFDTTKFPDAKAMVSELHSKGIAVTTWVPPFINLESSNFDYAATQGYLMKDMSGIRPAFVSWWEARWAGIIDFTNPNATAWFLGNLENLRTIYGIDSFKFDAGDANYLPYSYTPYRDFSNPDTYARTYAEAVAKVDDSSRRHEVRTGCRTQPLPAMTRMIDKDSVWTYEQGLKTVITSGLVFSSIGYSFILPDMIGGNGYNGQWPSVELFIRWLQANTLMPTMQFAIAPWSFNNATVISMTQKMLALREKYADKIVHLAKESVSTGAPIMRPMWWLAPDEESALIVDDQFLLGDDVLVAPVLDPGVTERKIYLSTGTWRDEIKGGTLAGGRWINYPVKLEDLPHFTKIA